MNITLDGTKITQDTHNLAFEKNNNVDEIVITVDTDESWSYKLDVKCPNKYNVENDRLYNIIDLDRNGNICSATLTRGMLPFNGKYTMQLRGINGDKVYHSDTFEVWVKYSIEPGSTYDPVPSEFYQIEKNLDIKVNEAKQYVEAAEKAAVDAKVYADRAATLAADVSEKAAQTAQNASDAANAMEAAQTAQHLAAKAQGAAETAQKAAEVAQAAAETAATDADGAKQAAEVALKATQDAAEEAAQSLEALRTLYQEMQTWAAGVIQTVNAAADSASQSATSAAGSASAASEAQSAAETAQRGAEDAKVAATTAKAATEIAQKKAETAKAAAESSANRAEQAILTNGYAEFHIENGRLKLSRTANISDKLDFQMTKGRLEALIYG